MKLSFVLSLAALTAVPLMTRLLVPATARGSAPQTANKPAPKQPPLLTVTGEDGTTYPLSVAQADVHVAISGPLAQTTVILTFRNDTNRALEGNLDFPLPEGASLSGYGLDVNGTLVDGVPVEKRAARIAFEKEVRKGVDPGLVEQISGNSFRTRVYPIPANGTRTVKIQFESGLTTLRDNLVFTTPLRLHQQVAHVNFQVTVAELSEAAQAAAQGDSSPFFSLDRDRRLSFVRQSDGSWMAEQSLDGILLDNDLTIVLPHAAEKAQVGVEKFFPAGPDGVPAEQPDYLFALRDVPPLFNKRAALGQLSQGDVSKRIAIIWDASLSRRNADTARELRLLSRLLRRAPDVGPLTVDVTVVRNEAAPTQTFTLTGGDTTALLSYLRNQPFDGGTNLSAVHLPANRDAYCLLFTDGQISLGDERVSDLPCPVYALTNDADANLSLLRRWADRSGGALLDLRSLEDTDVAEAVAGSAPSLLGVRVLEGKVDGLYPGGARPLSGEAVVTGRLLSETATISLDYGVRGHVSETRRFTLSRTDARGTRLIGPYWAKQKADDLSAFPEKNGDDLLALGRAYNIVTPRTSLLVLETLEQYLQYNIAPPRSLPALYDAYLGRREQGRKAEKQDAQEKLKHVAALWDERVQWSNTTFKYAKNFRYGATEEDGASGLAHSEPRVGHSLTGRVAGLSAPTTSDRIGAAPRPMARATPAPGSARRFGVAGAAPMRAQSQMSAHSSAGFVSASASGTGAAMAKTADGDAAEGASTEAEIAVKPWSPDTPYLKAMRASGSEEAYSVYLSQRKKYGNAPAFYLDCAEYLIQNGKLALGIRILTGIVDLGLDDPGLFRIVAHRLQQLGYRDQAIALFERVRRIRPDEPQSWRDLALALSDRADDTAASHPDAALRDYNRALVLLNKVVSKQWDRFEEIETIALMEANRLVVHAKAVLPAETLARTPLVNPLSPNLTRPIPCAMRILLTWDTDQTDMDLWVTEPSGEKCLYSHNRTVIGGRLSKDFTQGYGPEEYCLKHAMPGTYTIQANYYGTSQQNLTGGTTVQATVITNFGLPTEKRRYLTLRLRQAKDTVDIGKISVN